MRRVVVTGFGIVSSIGSNKAEVLDALRPGRSGIAFCHTYAEMGFRRHVHGSLKVDLDTHVDREVRRLLGDGAATKIRPIPATITPARRTAPKGCAQLNR